MQGLDTSLELDNKQSDGKTELPSQSTAQSPSAAEPRPAEQPKALWRSCPWEAPKWLGGAATQLWQPSPGVLEEAPITETRAKVLARKAAVQPEPTPTARLTAKPTPEPALKPASSRADALADSQAIPPANFRADPQANS